MSANPIEPMQLEALCRQLLIPLTAWEASVLYRMDDATLAVWAASETATSAPEETEVPITDRAGVRGLLNRFKERFVKRT